jgi:AcrR family transcriptional regulator
VTRREVLDLSAKLFAARGYRSTSLELVADQLGVTRQALYYHFKNKGEILGALFEEMMTKLESGVAAVPDDQDVSSSERFVQMLQAHIEVTVANADLVALLLHERPEIAKLKELRAAKRRRDYARLFTETYDQGVAEGALSPMDPWIAVNTLISAINGVSWWYHGEGTSTGSQTVDLKESLLALLSHGFLVERPATAANGRSKPPATAARRAPKTRAA